MAMLDGLRRFWADRDGNFAIMTAVTLVPVIGAVGLAVDYSTMSRMRSELQSANDAAVLFATRYHEEYDRLPSKERVKDVIGANYPAVAGAPDIYEKDGQIWLESETTYKPWFMRIFSSRVEKIAAVSAAPIRPELDLEIVLALDTTGSMAKDKKMDGLKTAATNFIDAMFDAVNDRTRVKIGLVPFARYVNVGIQNIGQTWVSVPANWKGCVGSRPNRSNLLDAEPNVVFPGITASECPTPVAPLTDSKAVLLAQIATFTPNGMTYIVEGVMWGQRVLSPQAPFAEGLDPKLVSNEVRKIMVLMTDGDNTVSADLPQRPTHNGRDRSLADNWTRKACGDAEDNGVEIFTITFGTDVSDAAKSIMEKCAASPDHYFDAANSAKLNEAFANIAGGLTRIRLTH